MPTDVTYTPWHFYVALDNYTPPRKDLYGEMERYVHPVTGGAGIRFTGESAELFMKGKTVLLIDDGTSVEPHYSAGWNAEKGYILFHPFPVNPNQAVRPDNGRVTSYDNWYVGPSKAYHLKVRPVEFAHWHASVSENGRYTDRTKCFTGEIVTSLREAKRWLQDEMNNERSEYTNHDDFATILPKFSQAHLRIGEFSERSEGIDADVTVPWNDQEITYGYRIMAIDGDCEETIDV